MDMFSMKINGFLSEFGQGRKMVLSTSENNKVSSRTMSVVQINGTFYFQTDLNMRKYHQIKANNFVALCIDNIQIEGICEEIGHPLKNTAFCDYFQKCFKSSYNAYTSLTNERLFSVKPLYIERWIYNEGIPYIESFDMNNQQYKFIKYESE
jgi:hypothetical protein